jgi:uncharacterized protein (TIGR02001 family)
VSAAAPARVSFRRRFASNVPSIRLHTLRAIFSVLPLCLAAPAEAQLAASATVESDYRIRGVSLTDGRPDLSLSIAYDHDSGAYAGASAIGGRGAHDGLEMLGYVDYFGYAAHVGAGQAWDIGVSNANITDYIKSNYEGYGQYYGKQYAIRYGEFYSGLIFEHVSAHIYYSPSYLGEGLRTVYVDIDGAVRPGRRWRLFGHAGALTPVGGRVGSDSNHERYDLRTGAAMQFSHGELQLSWTAASPEEDYPAGYRQRRDAIVLSTTLFF